MPYVVDLRGYMTEDSTVNKTSLAYKLLSLTKP